MKITKDIESRNEKDDFAREVLCELFDKMNKFATKTNIDTLLVFEAITISILSSMARTLAVNRKTNEPYELALLFIKAQSRIASKPDMLEALI